MKLISIILLSLLSFNASSQAIYKGFAAKKYVVPNIAPVSNAGTDKSITLPTNSTTLSGSGTDADGTISAYSWVKISGPVAGTITSASSAVTALASLTAGTYIFTLTVTDNSGGTASDNVTVTVSPAANISPVANAGTDQAITLPTNSTTLSGSGSDADGTISSYSWIKLSGPASYIIVNTSSATTAINSLTAGVYQFQLTVTDNNGATNADVVQVTVNAAPPANIPPVANAGTNQTITLPTTTATLTGSGSDADGTVTGYAWTKLSGPTGGTITTPSSASTGITSLQAGIYQYQLTVTDNLGATGSNTTTVTVNSAANIAPIANAGPDKSRTLPSDTATLFGTGTDSDGTIVSYAWTKLVGSPSGGVIVNPSSATTFITGLIQGTYQYQLAVTDNSGAVNIDYVLINVAANPSPGTANGAFSFTLASSANTSAGVFKNDSILVRTLWSAENYAAGTYNKKWDGTDDYGNVISSPDATYKIKVLSNNVGYTWQGTIGNTSDSMTGNSKYKGYSSIQGIAFSGSAGYFCVGYSEGFSSLGKFNQSTPNTRIAFFSDESITGEISHVCTDGTNVYWGTVDSYSGNNSFVFATKTLDDTETSFSSGVPYKVTYGKNYVSVISKVNASNAAITSLVVQQTGNYLFVARGGYASGSLQVINKTTGALVQTLSLIDCKGLSIDPTADNSIWIIQGTVASKYTINTNGTLTAAVLTISGLINPLTTTVSPDGSKVIICDAGSSQQVKYFNNSTGASTSTIGIAGGYSNAPDVTNSKFYFGNEAKLTPFVAYQSDGSYWINDPGNYRTQHYSSSGTFINRIMFLGPSYTTWVDKNNINRMFNSYMEFAIDYSVQTLTGASGWTLVKNWGANVDPILYDDAFRGIYPVTLSNGRTYSFIQKGDNVEIVELVAGGTMRFTGILKPRPYYNNYLLCSDGSLQQSQEVGGIYTYRRYPFTGFDGSNNPLWSSTSEVIATAPKDDVTGSPITTSKTEMMNLVTNKVVFFTDNSQLAGGIFSQGYHLGVMTRGANNNWLFQTEKTTHRNYEGVYPKAGWFDVGNKVSAFAGGNVNIVDKYIITSFHGEFWKLTQTNKFNFYSDNGLAIGQFGTTRPETVGKSAAMMAGNALTAIVVKDASGDLYLYHGDESDHSAVHRWKITGLNTIAEQVITIPFPSSYTPPVLSYTNLMTGLPFDVVMPASVAGWTRTPSVDINVGKQWQILTSVQSYDKLIDNDITTNFFDNSTTNYTIEKSLGNNIVTNSWQLSGQIGYPGNGITTTGLTIFVDVLDNTDKVISRIYLTNFGGGVDTTRLFGNTKVIAKQQGFRIDAVGPMLPFSVTMNAGTISFTYGGYTTVTDTKFDVTANAYRPTKLQLKFNTVTGNVYGKTISIKNPLLYLDPF